MRTGWRTEPLGAVCQFLSRGISPAYLDQGGVSVLNQKCVRDHTVNFDLGRRHNADAKNVSPEKLVRVGDILVNSTGTGTLGRVAQIRVKPSEPTTVDSHVTIVRATEDLFYPEFFGYALVAIEEQIQDGGEGCGGQTELARSKLANDYRISFPIDREIQQRIVTLLDDAFNRIAIAKSNAEKNLQNARALFETYLESTFAQRNDDWTLKRLGDLATFRNGINFTKSSRGDTVKIVGVRDFQKDFWAPLDTLATVTTDGALPESDLLKENDLLFVRSNGNKELIGRCLLLGPVGERITHSGFTIRARLHGGDVKARYLCHFLKSNKARREMIDSGAGANISSLNQTALAGLVIPFPSVSAQGLIVQQIQTVAAQTQRLESIYQQKLAALDELKKSLLHQAFSGAL